MPSKSKPIQVKLSGTGTIAYQRAKVINRTTNEKHPTATAFSANKILAFDCAEFPNGWTAGDIIEVSTLGGAYGNTLITLSGTKSQKATLTATTESTTLPKGGN